MIKVIMHGCCGKMGKVVCQLVNDDPDCELVAGIDPFGENADFPVFKSVFDCDVDADVIIDFSNMCFKFSSVACSPCNPVKNA